MPDTKLCCASCGKSFTWTEREQKIAEADAVAAEEPVEVPSECKGCRPKQDGMRG